MRQRIDSDVIAKLTPRGGLQAAEFEDDKTGRLSVQGRDVIYTDASTGAALLRLSFANNEEAKLQMRFYRSTYSDVKARRASFQIVAP